MSQDPDNPDDTPSEETPPEAAAPLSREQRGLDLAAQLNFAFGEEDEDEEEAESISPLAAPLPPEAEEEEDPILRRFREEAEHSLGLIRERLETYVQALDPDMIWTPLPHNTRDWDTVLVGRKSEHIFWVSLRVLSELGHQDLTDILEEEEAFLEEPEAGREHQTHAYLVVSPVLRNAGRLFVATDGFNQRNWNHEEPSRPRGFLAYSDLDGSTPVIPGVQAPTPDLAQILVALDPETAAEVNAPAPEAWSPDLEDFPELAELPELPEAKVDPTEDPDKFNVLLVDSDPGQLEVVQGILGTWSYVVEQACDWSSFQSCLASQTYSVLVMDQGLGVFSGGQLALAVNSDDLIQPKPRIVLRAELPELELRSAGSLLGAHTRVSKSSDEEEFKDAVRTSAMAYFKDKLEE